MDLQWAVVLGVLFSLLAPGSKGSLCANSCSGHGTCSATETSSICSCELLWDTEEGPDCSLRECPKGAAWADHATATDTAHNLATCSNMGVCDRETGLCVCEPGFEGLACERLSCPSTASGICNKRGKCMSMREAALTKNGVQLLNSVTYSLWDADKIFGCVCDEGYGSYDCSQRTCPYGADTVGVSYVTEKQILECTCPTTCSGYFYLKYKGEYVKIYHHDTAAKVKERLEAMTSIPGVDVTFYGGTTVCDNDGVSTEINFRYQPGNLPDIVLHSSYTTTLTTTSSSVAVSIKTGGTAGTAGGTSRTGTAVTSECSGRGACETTFGRCSCQNSGIQSTGGLFAASNGEGATGTRTDCGYASLTPTGCPYADDGTGTPAQCAGHGTCTGTVFKCACSSGYTGHDCSKKSCPTGPAWFDEASATNVAHATATCSNMGICDHAEGTCVCRSGFEGTACQLLACPGVAAGAEVCNGHGTCYTMKQLALLSQDNGVLRGVTYGATPTDAVWDHSSVQGCYCDTGYFHGPFAWDFSDFAGSYDCTRLNCPKGDNPQTTGQTNEVQTIKCIATSGTFKVTFRQVQTPAIAYDATVATLKAALDSLYSIHEVGVAFSGGSTTAACSSGAGTTITLTFKVPGDLPLVEVDSSQLGGATISIEEVTQGTTEFIECSGQGTCDELTGICGCYQQYISSDGSGDGITVGQRGDCGAMYIFRTLPKEDEEEA